MRDIQKMLYKQRPESDAKGTVSWPKDGKRKNSTRFTLACVFVSYLMKDRVQHFVMGEALGCSWYALEGFNVFTLTPIGGLFKPGFVLGGTYVK